MKPNRVRSKGINVNKPIQAKCAALLLFCITLLAAGSLYAGVVDRIVAVVNDDVILLSEMNKILAPYIRRLDASGYPAEQKEQILFKLKQDALDGLVEKRLVDQEVARYGLSVSENEVDATIERYKQAQMMTQEDLEKALKEDGLTFSEYRESVKQELLRPKLINMNVKSKVIVTDEDIKNYYENNKDKYGEETEYHLYNILIRKDTFSLTNTNDPGLEKMNAIRARLDNGEDFKDLAAKVSEAPNRDDSGNLGFFKPESFSDEIKTAIENLSPGSSTKVLNTDAGYQIFYLEEVRKTKGKTFEEVSDQIHMELYNNIVKEKFKNWLKSIRERAHIKLML